MNEIITVILSLARNIVFWPIILLVLGFITSIPFKNKICNVIVNTFSTIACLLMVYISLKVLLQGFTAHIRLEYTIENKYAHLIPFTNFEVYVDPLSAYFILILGIVGFAASVYGISYMSKFYGVTSLRLFSLYYTLFLGSMYMVFISFDLVYFILFWELTTLTAAFLVAYDIRSEVSRKASIKFFVLSNASTICIIAGILIAALMYGTTSFTNISSSFRAYGMDKLVYLVIATLLTVGFSVKAALIPLHSWLPDAHPEAPCNVSALLSGVMIKLAPYGFLRMILYVFEPNIEWGLVLAVLGALTLVTGTMLALIQTDSKKLLAYHSVGQMGYITLGIGGGIYLLSLNNPTLNLIGIFSVMAGLYHALNHAVFKSLLFLTAGSVLYRTHSRNLNVLGGLATLMPLTFSSALIASLSISGIPPFNGFVSKWLIYTSLLSSYNPILIVCVILAIFISAVTTASFVKYISTIFLSKPQINVSDVKESPPTMTFSMIFLSILCIILGVYPLIALKILSNVMGYLLHIPSTAIMTCITPLPSIALIKPIVGAQTQLSTLIVAFLMAITISASILIMKPIRYRRTSTWVGGVRVENIPVKYLSSSYYTEFEHSYSVIYVVRKWIYRVIINPLTSSYLEKAPQYDWLQKAYVYSFTLALYLMVTFIVMLSIWVLTR